MNNASIPTHPEPADWAGYLYGELPPESHAQMDDHLRSCPECQKQVRQWRETLGHLDSWKLSRPVPARRSAPTYVRWAAAAAIVLGAGWIGGRLSAPAGVSPEQLRVELLPALRQELRQDFEAQLASSLGAADERTHDKLVELAEAWARTREDDKQATLALYQRLDRQQRLDTATLRRDLETVAVVAETAIGDTQDKLTQLAVNSLATPASYSPSQP